MFKIKSVQNNKVLYKNSQLVAIQNKYKNLDNLLQLNGIYYKIYLLLH